MLSACTATCPGRKPGRTQPPGPHKKGLWKLAGFRLKQLSPGSVLLRLASPFFLAPAATYPQVHKLAEQTKADAALAEAGAARPGVGWFYAAPCLALYPFPNSITCFRSGFERGGGGGGTRRRQRARHGLLQLRFRPRALLPRPRLSSHEEGGLLPGEAVLSADLGAAPRIAPLFCRPLSRTTRSSWRSTPLAPRFMSLALMRDSATRLHLSPSSASSTQLKPNLFLCRDKSGGMDKPTRRPGRRWGESSAR
jgi:hypothetical protein